MKMIGVRCPACKVLRQIPRDEADPAGAALIELPCISCETGETTPLRYRDKRGRAIA